MAWMVADHWLISTQQGTNNGAQLAGALRRLLLAISLAALAVHLAQVFDRFLERVGLLLVDVLR
jgi:hypothetical protein